MTKSSELKLWITYAWVDDNEGDFSFWVQELKSIGVEAVYDKVAIIPGQYLWAQISSKITEGDISGWAYLVTPSSLESEACREELAYALDRTLRTRGRDFPLIGLLHGIRVSDLPPALRVRLCVSLANPDWKEEILAGLEERPPIQEIKLQGQHIVNVYQPYGNKPHEIAIEVRPRFGELMYWRFVVPSSSDVLKWGYGPSGGYSIASIKRDMVEGQGEINGISVKWFGSGDRLSPGVSAYVIFNEKLPEFIGFGNVAGPYEHPTRVEKIYPIP